MYLNSVGAKAPLKSDTWCGVFAVNPQLLTPFLNSRYNLKCLLIPVKYSPKEPPSINKGEKSLQISVSSALK